VPLQDGTPSLDTVSFDKPYYVGITVGGDPEMTPRQEMGSSFGSVSDFQVKNNLVVKSGKFGLGTDSPGTPVHIVAPAIQMTVEGTANQSAQIEMIDHQSNAKKWRFVSGMNNRGSLQVYQATDNIEAVEISPNGNVGIGISNPQAKLHAMATGLEVLRLERTGTTPAQYRFHVQPVMSGDNSDLQIIADTNATGYGFYSRNAQGIANHGMGIDRHGNVGIGTESPQYKLDVAGSVHCTGAFVSSDRRLKKNIRGFSKDVVGGIQKLNGVSYEWDRAQLKELGFGRSKAKEGTRMGPATPAVVSVEGEQKDDFAGRQIGLIAQEVGEVFPDLVHTDSRGIKSVNYSALTAVLVEGMKAQQKQIAALREEVDQLRKKIK
jgi:hypothetical protein